MNDLTDPITTAVRMQRLKEHEAPQYRAVVTNLELGARAAQLLTDAQPVLGWHFVAPGDRFIYRGNDASLWGEPGEVISLAGIDFRCRVRFDRGEVLAMVDEHGLSAEGGAR